MGVWEQIKAGAMKEPPPPRSSCLRDGDEAFLGSGERRDWGEVMGGFFSVWLEVNTLGGH